MTFVAGTHFSVACDFLNCPANSQCVEDFNGVLCQCLTGYNEITFDGQFACIGKQLHALWLLSIWLFSAKLKV